MPKICKRKLNYEQSFSLYNQMITKQSKRKKIVNYNDFAKHYGYPKCCQKAFTQSHNIISVQKKTKYGFDNGFIPCDFCFQHKNKKKIYSYIQKKRKSIRPISINTQQNEKKSDSIYYFKSLKENCLAFKENIHFSLRLKISFYQQKKNNKNLICLEDKYVGKNKQHVYHTLQSIFQDSYSEKTELTWKKIKQNKWIHI